MAIVNRDKNITEQIETFGTVLTTTVAASAGLSFHAVQAPYPGILRAVNIAANAVSGTPVITVDVKRWSGAGVTTILSVGSTLTVTPHGISTAYQSVSLVAVGSTLAQLQAGDVVVINQSFSSGNVSVSNAVVSVSIQALQDMKEHFGIVS